MDRDGGGFPLDQNARLTAKHGDALRENRAYDGGREAVRAHLSTRVAAHGAVHASRWENMRREQSVEIAYLSPGHNRERAAKVFPERAKRRDRRRINCDARGLWRNIGKRSIKIQKHGATTERSDFGKDHAGSILPSVAPPRDSRLVLAG